MSVQVQELLQDRHFQEILEKMVAETVSRFVQRNEERAREISLIERVVRVEEELRALREIEAARFEAIEKRFEALQREMNARFEAMEKRFEALQREMNARFEAMDKRFEAVEKRFETIEKRLAFMQWFIGVGFTLILLLITLSNFFLR